MESDSRAALREMQRAEAAPYIDYPPTPTWYYPAAGLWAAALVLAATQYRSAPLASVLGLIVLVALEFGFLSWYSRYHGALPSLRGNVPPEIRAAHVRFFAGLAVLGLLAVAVWVSGGAALTAGYVLVAVTRGLWCYERDYARCARLVRERLG